jgi:hypothetical protein
VGAEVLFHASGHDEADSSFTLFCLTLPANSLVTEYTIRTFDISVAVLFDSLPSCCLNLHVRAGYEDVQLTDRQTDRTSLHFAFSQLHCKFLANR